MFNYALTLLSIVFSKQYRIWLKLFQECTMDPTCAPHHARNEIRVSKFLPAAPILISTMAARKMFPQVVVAFFSAFFFFSNSPIAFLCVIDPLPIKHRCLMQIFLILDKKSGNFLLYENPHSKCTTATSI